MHRRRSDFGISFLVVIAAAACLSLPVASAEEEAPEKNPPAAAAGDEPLAVEEHEIGEVEVSLLELKRTSGNTLTMKWQYENSSEEAKPLYERSGAYHDDPYGLALEAYIVDPANKKKYLVVKDSKNVPVAAKHPQGENADIEVGPGKTLKTWAKFPAPSAKTEKVTVYLSGIPPLEDVPIGE